MEVSNDFFAEEVRNGYKITKEMKELWSILLKLSLELKRVCDKYKLKYFLHDGSLLGAIRHNGFIPWDDDMDFILPRKDFDKFLEVASKEIKSPYYLQTLDNASDIFNNGRLVLRIDDTTYIRNHMELYAKDHQGIGIDILALDTCPEDIKLRNKQWNKTEKYSGMLYMKKYGKNIKRFSLLDWGRLKTRCIYYLSKLISDKFLIKQLNKYFTLHENSSSSKCVANNEAFKYRRIVFDKAFFKESIMVQFENLLLPVPNGYNEILKKIYGENYMELPPLEEQKANHSIIVNTKESYEKVLAHFQNIFDNTDNKEIVVFGAGQMFQHYLLNTKKWYRPVFVVDNNSKKWNTEINGFKICNPEEILKIPKEKHHVIICSIYYKEIIEQLKNMGVENYFVYIQNINWL